jgi:hypothetical protein
MKTKIRHLTMKKADVIYVPMAKKKKMIGVLGCFNRGVVV